MGSSNTNVPLYPSLENGSARLTILSLSKERGKGRFHQHNSKIPLYPPLPKGDKNTRNWEGVKKWILTEDERGYWKSFRAVPFYRQLLTVKNLNHSRSLAEPCNLCLSKTAILKLWRYLRSTDSPNFFTASEGLLMHPFRALDSRSHQINEPLPGLKPGIFWHGL